MMDHFNFFTKMTNLKSDLERQIKRPDSSCHNTLLVSTTALDWAQAPYETCPYYPERKIHTAPGGLLVRSKLEAMIATLLTENNIPYRYEWALQLGNKIFYPDFTLRHPETGQLFYWEHLGKMDDPVYKEQAMLKLHHYAKHEIIPHHGRRCKPWRHRFHESIQKRIPSVMINEWYSRCQSS